MDLLCSLSLNVFQNYIWKFNLAVLTWVEHNSITNQVNGSLAILSMHIKSGILNLWGHARLRYRTTSDSLAWLSVENGLLSLCMFSSTVNSKLFNPSWTKLQWMSLFKFNLKSNFLANVAMYEHTCRQWWWLRWSQHHKIMQMTLGELYPNLLLRAGSAAVAEHVDVQQKDSNPMAQQFLCSIPVPHPFQNPYILCPLQKGFSNHHHHPCDTCDSSLIPTSTKEYRGTLTDRENVIT